MYFTIININDKIKPSKGNTKKSQIKRKEITHMFKKIATFLSSYYSEFSHREA